MQALVQFSRQMAWQRVSVVYSQDSYSKSIVKSIAEKAAKSSICLESLTEVSDTQVSIASPGNNVTAVWIISPPEDAQNLINSSIWNDNHTYHLLFSQPWSAEETNLLEFFNRQSDVYALTVSPVIIDIFESYWNKRKNPSLAKTSENMWILEYLSSLKKCRISNVTIDANWPPCYNLNVGETKLDRLLRHTRVLPAVHVLNTMASAVRKAWDLKCSKISGYCASLKRMTRIEFLEIFNALEVQHDGPGNRVPPGIVGYKNMTTLSINGVKFSLVFSAHGTNGSQVDEVYSYSADAGMQTVSKTFEPKTVSCLSSCVSCKNATYVADANAPPKASLLITPEPKETVRATPASVETSSTTSSIIEIPPSTSSSDTLSSTHSSSVISSSTSEEAKFSEDVKSRNETQQVSKETLWLSLESPESLNESVQRLDTYEEDLLRRSSDAPASYETASIEDKSSIPSSNNIIIPALFPVHKAGATPLQCSAEINYEAIQDIEAFLWALDNVNQHVELLNGVEIGAVIYDTCSSAIKASHIVSSILSKEEELQLEGVNIDPDRLWTVVSVTSGDETEAVASILAPTLITTISAKDRSDSRTSTSHQLQVAVPMSVAAKAVLELLTHYGWSYVSVIYSTRNADTVAGFRHFVDLSESSDICIGLVQRFDKFRNIEANLLESLAASAETGSQVVILWTDDEDTDDIISQLSQVSSQTKSVLDRFVWINGNGWSETSKLPEVGKWIALKPDVRIVPEFAAHFSQLGPQNNERNPWYAEFWQQVKDCPHCQQNSNISTSTSTVVQSVYVIASALARMIQDYCVGQKIGTGNCFRNATAFRQTAHNYLRMTGTDRPGDADGEFGFTEDGYGDTALEIIQIQQTPSAKLDYHKIGTFSGDNLQMGPSDPFSIISECKLDKKDSCYSCLAKQQNQMLMRNSKDKLYIMGLFDVRQKNVNGLWTCANNVTSFGIQQTEAFLWALDYVNQLPNLLPGVQLGAIGLDGCGTHEKRTTELAQIFSTPPSSTHLNVNDTNIVGLVVGTKDADPRTFVDLHNRHHIPIVLSPPALESGHNEHSLIQLGPSVSTMAHAIVEILNHFNWNYVSSVCSYPAFPYGSICEEFQSQAAKRNITYAADVAILATHHSTSYWENVATSIVEKSLNGAHVLVALLPENQLAHLLAAIRNVQTKASILMITLSDGKMTEPLLSSLLGVIGLRNRMPSAGKFFEDFEHKKLKLNNSNPWMMAFWKQNFACRGVICENWSLNQLAAPIEKDTSVANTINGVLAIAYGLEYVRRELCPDMALGVCDAMFNQDLRQRVERAIMDHPFYDINRRLTSLNPNGVADDAAIEITNIYQSLKQVERHQVATFSNLHGLTVDGLKITSVREITSKCSNCQREPAVKSWQTSQYMEIETKQKPGFSLLGLLSFHRQGLKPLSCGSMNDPGAFQNLAAVSFAVNRISNNETTHGPIDMGAIVFDSCGRVERAQQRLISFLSENSSSTIIGSVTLDGETAHAVSNVLNEESISLFNIASDGYRYPSKRSHDPFQNNLIVQTVPSAEDETKAIFEIVYSLEWKHVVIFYDNSESGSSDRELLVKKVQATDICIGAEIRVGKFGQAANATDLHSLLESISTDLPPLSVAVLLLDSPTQVQHVISVLQDVGLGRRFIIVANHALGNNRQILLESSIRQLTGILTVSMETEAVPGYNEFLSNLTLENHSSIPKDWFQEYFQHHFQCQLVDSPVVQKIYPKLCSGTERFSVHDSEQDPFVYHTVLAVETYAEALKEFLQYNCTLTRHATQLSDCGLHSRQRFNIVLNEIIQRQHSKRVQPVRALTVWNIHMDKQKSYDRVGFWRFDRFHLESNKLKFHLPYKSIPAIECLQGSCLAICSVGEQTTKTSVVTASVITSNFSTAWGVVAVIFCVLGMIAVVSCSVYFIRNISNGSCMSLLDCIILVGLAVLYVASIFFLLEPTAMSCGLRRFFLGISYAAIFSGILVRSFHAWRWITRGDAQTHLSSSSSSSSIPNYEIIDKSTRPALVLTSLILIAIQIILLVAWLIFKTPAISQMEDFIMRCSPADNFESELVASLTLPILLLLAANVFSAIVWRSSEPPKDSRSFLACTSLLSFTFFIWTLVATQASYQFR